MSWKSVINFVARNTVTDENMKFKVGKAAMSLGQGFLALNTYNGYKDEGKSTIGAIGETAVDYALWPLLGFTNWALYEMASNAGAVVEGMENLSTQHRSFMQESINQMPFRTNTFVDNEQIYTMRQAGMALANKAKYNVESAMMGNEAQYMHR